MAHHPRRVATVRSRRTIVLNPLSITVMGEAHSARLPIAPAAGRSPEISVRKTPFARRRRRFQKVRFP